MIEVASGWNLAVDRGPDCLFVTLLEPAVDALEAPPLADTVWRLMEEHLTHRLVLEMQHVPMLSSYLIGQLVLLNRRLQAQGLLLRLCGLSPAAKESLITLHLDSRFPSYQDRTEAVMGGRPLQPR